MKAGVGFLELWDVDDVTGGTADSIAFKVTLVARVSRHKAAAADRNRLVYVYVAMMVPYGQ